MNWLDAPLQYWRSGGPLLIPLSVVCMAIWFLFLRSRARLAADATVVTRLAHHFAQNQSDIPRDVERAGYGYVAQALAAGSVAVAVFEEESERRLAFLKRDFGILRALTIVAPLLGLLGTVMGMIVTFVAVSNSGGDTAHRVADGVSRALITTQVGLVVAIPGVFGQLHLRRLLARLQVLLGALKLHVFTLTNEGAA
jgi:biopolymer transport protein ExbB